MPASPADLEFLHLGFQYYVAARSAAQAQLLPVCGNLAHHAIEMFLKAGLSRTIEISELKKRSLGHNLPAVWEKFKSLFEKSELAEFDQFVELIHRFEDIRYLDKILDSGAQILIDWSSKPDTNQLQDSPPIYHLRISDLDRFVVKIFKASSRSLKFFGAPIANNLHARSIIEYRNTIIFEFF